MQLKLSSYDWCISILSSKKFQTPINLADLLENEVFFNGFKRSLFVICDWWNSILFVSFCVSGFVACDLIVLAELSFHHVSYLVQDVCVADIRLASLVYVSTFCVPIAHLRQNKPFPLLDLGNAQIIMFKRRTANG